VIYISYFSFSLLEEGSPLQKLVRQKDGFFSASYSSIPIAILVLVILGLYYYNTSYLPSLQREERTPQYVERGMSQIFIAADTPDNLTSTIPHFCDATNTTCDYHWHVHLDILVNRTSYVLIPSLLGHINNSQYDLYAIHTHDYSGIIHIECCIPHENVTFTLGDLFDEWGYPLFDSSDCLIFHNQPVSVYVDGEMRTDDSTPISGIKLEQHEEIAILIGTNTLSPSQVPAVYDFPAGF
jgi:hypothetical protein